MKTAYGNGKLSFSMPNHRSRAHPESKLIDKRGRVLQGTSTKLEVRIGSRLYCSGALLLVTAALALQNGQRHRNSPIKVKRPAQASSSHTSSLPTRRKKEQPSRLR